MSALDVKQQSLGVAANMSDESGLYVIQHCSSKTVWIKQIAGILAVEGHSYLWKWYLKYPKLLSEYIYAYPTMNEFVRL